MTDDEQKALDEFIREQHAKKGNDFKDEMVAADANLADLFPGKTVSCGAVAKARKAMGIMLPKGRSNARKLQAALKPADKKKKKCDAPRSTGDLNNVRDHLVAKREKIDQAISAIDTAILAAEGLF